MQLEATVDDDNSVIVIDMGTRLTKIGFCGQDTPLSVIPTCSGIKIIHPGQNQNTGTGQGSGDAGNSLDMGYGGSDSEIMGGGGSGGVKRKVLIGEKAYEHITDSSNLYYPVERGSLNLQEDGNKESVEAIYNHIFHNILCVEPEDHRILILDSPTSPNPNREFLLELLFEKFKCKSLSLFNTAIMSLFSTGRTRGLVLEVGAGVSHAVPVFEGYAIPHAIFKSNLGGIDLTNALYDKCLEAKLSSVSGQSSSSIEDLQNSNLNNVNKTPFIMDKMKEKVCECCDDYDFASGEKDVSSLEQRSFELPDGSIVQIPSSVRYYPSEILFDKTLVPGKSTLQDICVEALGTLDADFRNELVNQVLVTGGTSMLPGIASRLETELYFALKNNSTTNSSDSSTINPSSQQQNPTVYLDSQRKNSAWVGGSMFASFSTFENFVIGRDEYEEGKTDLKSLVSKKGY